MSVWTQLPKTLAVACCGLVLSACPKFGGDKTDTQQHMVIAKPVHTVSHLYYSGNIMPLVTTNALSPVDGRITEIKFNYGDEIKKDQVLAEINSTQLSDDYHQTINNYLEKKDALDHQKFLFPGTSKLYEAQVISKYQFLEGKSALATARLEYMQAKYELEKVLKKALIDPKFIESLSVDKTQDIRSVLQQKFSHIDVRAQSDGVALFPSNADPIKKEDADDETLKVGHEVKTGQLILAIGNQEGLSTQIKVSEVDVNRLKVGMPVIVTGDAFADETLPGYIQSIASQAQNDKTSNLNVGQFDVMVAIPNVSAEQRKKIHVGMSCKVDVPIHNPSHIMLPLNAVWERDGQHYVTIVDPDSKRRLAIPVLTGHTTLTSVAILSGIKKGDKVIIHDPT